MDSPLFSYRKADTPLHKIPGFIKIVFQFILCLLIFAGFNSKTAEIICLSVCSVIIFSAFILSKIHLKSLKKIRFVFFIGAFYTIFKVLGPLDLSNFSTENFRIISRDKNQQIILFSAVVLFPERFPDALLYTFRFFMSSLSAFILFDTTSPVEIKFAFETAQNHIAKIFPAIKKINPAMIITLAVNFIPQIFSTWRRIDLATKARLGKNRRKNPLAFIRILYAEMTALLSCLINQAETKRKALVNRSEPANK